MAPLAAGRGHAWCAARWSPLALRPPRRASRGLPARLAVCLQLILRRLLPSRPTAVAPGTRPPRPSAPHPRSRPPGPAQDAVLAALPRPARRCLRAACRAGRAAVDDRITSVALRRTSFAAGLAAAAPRLPALRRVDFCSAWDCGEVDAAAAAVAALAPALTSVALAVSTHDDTARDFSWGGPFARLAAALGQCPRLEAVRLKVPKAAWGDLAEVLAGAAPGMSRLSLTVPAAPFDAPLAKLDLPWRQLQEMEMDCLAPLLSRLMSARPGGLAALRGLKLNGNMRGLDALWAAPWLTQLTRLEVWRWVERDDDGDGGGAGAGAGGSLLAGLVNEGRALPALQELGLTGAYAAGGGFTPADAARLAACRLPALRRLALSCIAPGALPPLMAAGWAAGLRDLSVAGTEPEWCGAAGAAALSRPSALTRLSFGSRFGRGGAAPVTLGAAELSALLSASWSMTLLELSLIFQDLGGNPAGEDAARALAAVRLARLRVLTLNDTRLAAAGVAALAAAPWLPGLTALTLERNPGLAACLGDLARLDLRGLRSFALCDLSPHPGFRGEQLLTLSGAPWLRQLEAVKVKVQATPGDMEDVLQHHRACFMALSAPGPLRACAERGADADLFVARPRQPFDV
ncbi:MAG: hypothetical protein J3K34DRAFT_57973 [Monoraphidium minutum]|nr:MAG: hypothetical protein J3K34DRAFT_57973 [Monoraphidium minutum]